MRIKLVALLAVIGMAFAFLVSSASAMPRAQTPTALSGDVGIVKVHGRHTRYRRGHRHRGHRARRRGHCHYGHHCHRHRARGHHRHGGFGHHRRYRRNFGRGHRGRRPRLGIYLGY